MHNITLQFLGALLPDSIHAPGPHWGTSVPIPIVSHHTPATAFWMKTRFLSDLVNKQINADENIISTVRGQRDSEKMHTDHCSSVDNDTIYFFASDWT